MYKTQISIFFFLAIFGMSSAGWAATFYVDNNNGNDGDPGTFSRPWRTIDKANRSLYPGDIVYLRQGTYRETIKPQRSGTAGNYITYTSYPNEEATIDGAYDGADLRNKSYIILDGLNITNAGHYWVNMEGNSTYNIIRNSYMSRADGWGGILLRDGANYNKIQNNTLVAVCSGGAGGPHDTIMVWNSHHNLIEDNNVDKGTHVAINIEGRGTSPSYNIVRNNILSNPWHSNLSFYGDSGLSLAEGNIILDAGENYTENMCGSDRDRGMARNNHKGLQTGTTNLIVRNNVMINNGVNVFPDYSYDAPDKVTDNLRMYNNTLYLQYTAVYDFSDGGIYGNIWKNNIIYGRNKAVDHYDSYAKVYFINNNIMNGSIRFNGQNDPAHWSGNLSIADPKFVDAANRDLNLQSNSPMINAGAFLTTTRSAGIGTSIPVDDARYFMDGWGIIEGDMIQLQGQTQTARITNVNYDTNIIAVDTNLTWTMGQGVSLAYEGSAPDIGAYEYGQSSSDPSDPSDPPPVQNGTTLIEAESGSLTTPMVVISSSESSGGSYIAPPTSSSGSATYTFNIEKSGTYKIIARVNAEDASSDSFLVTIDDGAEDTWDLNPGGNPEEFNVWREDEIAKRGTGTFDNPQHDPYTIELEQGVHTITFSGRESNTKLDYFYFAKVQKVLSAAPKSLNMNFM